MEAVLTEERHPGEGGVEMKKAPQNFCLVNIISFILGSDRSVLGWEYFKRNIGDTYHKIMLNSNLIIYDYTLKTIKFITPATVLLAPFCLLLLLYHCFQLSLLFLVSWAFTTLIASILVIYHKYWLNFFAVSFFPPPTLLGLMMLLTFSPLSIFILLHHKNPRNYGLGLGLLAWWIEVLGRASVWILLGILWARWWYLCTY